VLNHDHFEWRAGRIADSGEFAKLSSLGMCNFTMLRGVSLVIDRLLERGNIFKNGNIPQKVLTCQTTVQIGSTITRIVPFPFLQNPPKSRGPSRRPTAFIHLRPGPKPSPGLGLARPKRARLGPRLKAGPCTSLVPINDVHDTVAASGFWYVGYEVNRDDFPRFSQDLCWL
jgi:hypothetical protein